MARQRERIRLEGGLKLDGIRSSGKGSRSWAGRRRLRYVRAAARRHRGGEGRLGAHLVDREPRLAQRSRNSASGATVRSSFAQCPARLVTCRPISTHGSRTSVSALHPSIPRHRPREVGAVNQPSPNERPPDCATGRASARSSSAEKSFRNFTGCWHDPNPPPPGVNFWLLGPPMSQPAQPLIEHLAWTSHRGPISPWNIGSNSF